MVVMLPSFHRRQSGAFYVCVGFLQRFVGLPHDSFKLVPVPDPIGGVLVLSMNAIIYLNQHHTRGVSLNGWVQCDFRLRAVPDTLAYML